MDVSNITGQATAGLGQQNQSKKSQLGQQEFLHLLVAQMRNQDPINPMDGAEFASQLAQFNSVEQLIGVNDGLKMLQSSQDMMSSSLTNSMAASLTGKQVKALSSQVHLNATGDSGIQFELNNSADTVDVIIRNGSGTEVRRETLNGLGSGDHSWTWDGLNNAGERMGEGNYTVEVKAKNGDNSVGSLVFLEGIADRVRYTADGVYLSVNEVEIPIGDVEEVGTGIF